MSKIINLRTARKQKARATERATGDVQAARFGRSKSEKHRDQQERAKAKAHLDGHKRDQSHEP